jgi:tetratricopeptide (TPR) repeat protein
MNLRQVEDAVAVLACGMAVLLAGPALAAPDKQPCAPDKEQSPVTVTFGDVIKDSSLKTLASDGFQWEEHARRKLQLRGAELEFVALDCGMDTAVVVMRREGPQALRVIGVCDLTGGYDSFTQIYDYAVDESRAEATVAANSNWQYRTNERCKTDDGSCNSQFRISTDGKATFFSTLDERAERTRLIKEGRAALQKKDYGTGLAKLQGALMVSGYHFDGGKLELFDSLRVGHDNLGLMAEVGWAAFLAGDLAAAEQIGEGALKHASAKERDLRSVLLYNLGRVSEARNDAARAIERYRAALELRPGNKAIEERLGKLAAGR